jgi:hypothetical protein
MVKSAVKASESCACSSRAGIRVQALKRWAAFRLDSWST